MTRGSGGHDIPRGDQVVVLGGHGLWMMGVGKGIACTRKPFGCLLRVVRMAYFRNMLREQMWRYPFFSGTYSDKRFRENGQTAKGRAKYRLLMSGLSEAAQKQYFRYWAIWMAFHRWENRPPWLNPQEEERGVTWLVRILGGNKVVGISSYTIQGSIRAMRNMHLV